MAVGVALGVADPAPAQPPAGGGAPPPSAPQAKPGAAQALDTAIRAYRGGEFELAATWFQHAQAAQDELNVAQRTDLDIWIQLNTTDLKARREAGDQLRKADQAARAGRTQEAVTLLQGVASHQKFLTAADKQTYQRLQGQLSPGTTAPGTSTALTAARAKLRQARMMLAQGNHAGAETLARETERMNVAFGPNEDTPRKLLDEIARTRPPTRGTPDKNNAVTKGDGGNKPVLKGSEVARQLMKQSQQALQAGDLTTAMKLANEARAYKQDLSWWDKNPDTLVAEIQRVEASRKTTGRPANIVPDKRADDPRALVKKARDLYNAGNFAEAEKVALSVNNVGGVRWGLIEDSPEKLLTDIRKAVQKRDKEDSVKVLAEARRLYDEAKNDPNRLAQALELTNKAERMHGPYGMLEMGDRPQKLRAEIETAQARHRRQGITASPAPAVVQNNARTNNSGTVQVAHLPPPAPPTPPAPPAAAPRDNRAQPMPAGPRPDVTPPKLTAVPPVTPPPGLTPAPTQPVVQASPPAVDAAKQQALKLLDAARHHQKDGRLVEARKCALDAQNVKAAFRPEEDNPAKLLLSLSAQANRQVDALIIQANDCLASAGADPAKLQKAEACLNQSRALATAFGFDTKSIDDRLAALKRPAAPAIAQRTPAAPGGAAPRSRGDELLHQARLELRRGETGTARRLAVEAFSGKFGVEAEAEKMLRTIDAEEINQRMMAVARSYDAGVNAMQRQDATQALMIFRTIEPSLLPLEKQTKLKELIAGLDPKPAAAAQVAHQVPAVGTTPAPAAAPARDETYAQQVKAMQDVKYQQLREDGIRVQREAMDRFQAGKTDQALEMLDEHLASLRDAGLESQRIDMLRRPLMARVQQLKTMKAQRDFEQQQASQQNRHTAINTSRMLAEDNKNKQLDELMKQYRTLYKEGKYREAEMYAMRAAEIDPDNAQVSAAIATARMQRNMTDYNQVKKNKEEVFLRGLNDAEDPGRPVTSRTPIQFDPVTMDRIKDRKSGEASISPQKNEKEREIQRRLHTPVNLEFKDTSLEKAIDDLAEMTGINIHLHREALRDASIKADQPVTFKVSHVSLESALKIMLKDVGLTHHIENEVLNITTERHARGKRVVKTWPVADLVLPIENYTLPSREELLRISTPNQIHNLQTSGVQPYVNRNGMNGGTEVSPATLGSHARMSSSPGTIGGAVGGWRNHGSKGTIEDLLIKLITNTISPQSWSDMGGEGTIDYYPLGMALIINQTPDIQEQIYELLQALRRLQDQEVAIEVRFVSIAESFFERIGLDFNVNIKTNNTRYEPQIVTQQFKPFGFINDFQPKSTVIGLTPAGSFTSDLDIPIRTSSFGQAIPPFGPFLNVPGGNGGLSLGLAFLSDIQVFLFMEAAQGDQRTNVMQAPKLTMFNGQTSTITIEDQQYFVTNVNVVQGGGQIIFVPTNQLATTGGVSLTIQAVISADRRFVRMSMTPTLTNIASPVIQLFPITTFITPVFEGGAQGQPVPFTQFLQQPVFNSISVQTTVAVPDGGTVLLGGLKRLSEGRSEFGPPILSKLPWINRLFKNVGYGREAESLMMMVTPRIIINSEEEEKFLRENPLAPGQALPGQ